jgi:hypothetical protein
VVVGFRIALYGIERRRRQTPSRERSTPLVGEELSTGAPEPVKRAMLDRTGVQQREFLKKPRSSLGRHVMHRGAESTPRAAPRLKSQQRENAFVDHL